MCGRFTLAAGPEFIADYFHIDGPIPEVQPSWNITPGGDIPVICELPGNGRSCSLMHWGLIPHWAKEPDSKYKMINAKAETLNQRPAYRDAYKHRRCLIPANGFYEWQATPQGKQPYYIHRQDEGLLAFAGLWEYWEGEHLINSCTIITTKANPLLQTIHDRMPVILTEPDHAAWLNPRNTDTHLLDLLVRPCNSELLDMYPVSTTVNNPAHDGPELTDRT
jgi:putative SOS response-associated peptidase YedK